MCLENRKSKKQRLKWLSRWKGDTLAAFRVVRKNGYGLFSHTGYPETCTLDPGVYESQDRWQYQRKGLGYAPGFHVFKYKKQAQSYLDEWRRDDGFIQRIEIQKEWVQEIGKTDGCKNHIPALVVSHIRVVPQ